MSQAPAALEAALAALKEEFIKRKTEIWFNNVRNQISDAARKREEMIEASLLNVFENNINSSDTKKKIDPEKLKSDLLATLANSLEEPEVFRIELDPNFFDGVDTDASLVSGALKCAEQVTAANLRRPHADLDEVLETQAILKDHDRFESNFLRHVDEAIRDFEKSFEKFQEALQLRPPAEDKAPDPDPAIQEYENAFGRQIKKAVRGECHLAEEGDEGDIGSRLRTAVAGTMPEPDAWREAKNAVLTKMHVNVRATSEKIENLGNFAEALLSGSSPKATFDQIQTGINTLTMKLDTRIREAYRERSRELLDAVYEEAKKLQDTIKENRITRRRYIAKVLIIWFLLTIPAVSAIYFWGSIRGALEFFAGSVVTGFLFSNKESFLLLGLSRVKERLGLKKPWRVASPKFPSEGLIERKKLSVDRNDWLSDPIWDALKADVSEALSARADAVACQLAPYADELRKQSSTLNECVTDYDEAVKREIEEMRGRYTDPHERDKEENRALKFQVEALKIRHEWTNSVYAFFEKRLARLEVLEKRLNEVTHHEQAWPREREAAY